MNTNQPIRDSFHTKYNTISVSLNHTNINGIILHAFNVDHSIMEKINHNREENCTNTHPCISLAQVRSPRSSERGSLAQASPSRLGESSNNEYCKVSASSRLGESSSLGRDWSRSKLELTA